MRALNVFFATLSLCFVVSIDQYVEITTPNHWPTRLLALAAAFGLCAVVNLVSALRSRKKIPTEPSEKKE